MSIKFTDFLLVGFGGIVGAISRFTVGLLMPKSDFPFSTLIVNVLGSFLLGFLASMYDQQRISQPTMLFLGVGMMGSLTTMSTFGVETINSGSYELSTLNIVISLTGVLLGVILGKFAATLF